MEVVHDGWLVKSPPEKRILKAKWRQRWFVLRHSGLLPGQFVLEYYTDSLCKKLKGKIDLDQCEQVDAGLRFENRKSSYQYMFDIRTPKRIYYLVAETEESMNKWVECICSVCGLKIHIDEDYPVSQESQVTSAPVVVTSTPSITTTPTVSVTNLVTTSSGSNPYIPISECFSGKPLANGSAVSNNSDFPIDAPPPPPPQSGLVDPSHGGFYDYPRPLHFIFPEKSRGSPDPNIENLYNIPPQLRSPLTSDLDNVFNSLIEEDTLSTVPPKVNWNTYPKGSHATYKEEHGVVSLNNINGVTYDIVPPAHLCENREVQSSNNEMCRNLEQTTLHDAPNGSECVLNNQDETERHEGNVGTGQDLLLKPPPPRPPKPPSLRERKAYENVELPQASPRDEPNSVLYDVPVNSTNTISSSTKNLSPHVFSYTKEDFSDKDNISPSAIVPLQDVQEKESVVDEMYDFPKFRTEDNLNVFVPPPPPSTLPFGGSSQKHRRHAYTNAPPGLFNSKDLVFNYEYRPSLLSSDTYLSMDSKSSELYTDMSGETHSPLTPSSTGTYANVPTSPTLITCHLGDTPPAINRELKPKRKTSDGEGEGGPPPVVMLAPPTSKFRSSGKKRSFRKPRAAPSPTPFIGINDNPPPLPTRLRRRSDLSTSEDDLSSSGGSRRNSTNEEQARQFIPAPVKKGEEIQYLDLDLESETPAQSPRSPERLSASTVYKKVDFVKTKAFNEMRQNVEESYRKSQ